MLSVYLSVIDDAEDRHLFERIYNTYRKSMLYVAKSILHDSLDAEDAVHDVFLQVASKHMGLMSRMENEEDRRNYLLKATKNTALSMAKKKARITVDSELMDALDEIGYEELRDRDFVETLCTECDYNQVVDAMANLDETYSDALYYHFVLELSVSDAAELMGLKIETVRKKLVRGKKLLLQALSTKGVGTEWR